MGIGSDTDEAFQENLVTYGVLLLHGETPEGTASKIKDAICLHGMEAPSENFLLRLEFSSDDLKRALLDAIAFIVSTCKALVTQSHANPLCRYYAQRWADMGGELAFSEPGRAMLLFVFCHCMRDAADVWLWDNEEDGGVPV